MSFHFASNQSLNISLYEKEKKDLIEQIEDLKRKLQDIENQNKDLSEQNKKLIEENSIQQEKYRDLQYDYIKTNKEYYLYIKRFIKK